MLVGPNGLLRVHEVADALNVSRRTIHRWSDAGTLPVFVRLPNGERRYDPLDVDMKRKELREARHQVQAA